MTTAQSRPCSSSATVRTISASTVDPCPATLPSVMDAPMFAASVASRRGRPTLRQSPKGVTDMVGGDRYDLPTHVLHFSYERDVGVIEIVTLVVAGLTDAFGGCAPRAPIAERRYRV